MNEIPKTLILLGVVLIIAGVLAALFFKVPWIGKLPGDIWIRKGTFQFYFPLTTCLIISLVLTFIFKFFWKK